MVTESNDVMKRDILRDTEELIFDHFHRSGKGMVTRTDRKNVLFGVVTESRCPKCGEITRSGTAVAIVIKGVHEDVTRSESDLLEAFTASNGFAVLIFTNGSFEHQRSIKVDLESLNYVYCTKHKRRKRRRKRASANEI